MRLLRYGLRRDRGQWELFYVWSERTFVTRHRDGCHCGKRELNAGQTEVYSLWPLPPLLEPRPGSPTPRINLGCAQFARLNRRLSAIRSPFSVSLSLSRQGGIATGNNAQISSHSVWSIAVRGFTEVESYTACEVIRVICYSLLQASEDFMDDPPELILIGRVRFLAEREPSSRSSQSISLYVYVEGNSASSRRIVHELVDVSPS